MKVVLCGTHRTGKSTLAEAFARKNDFLYLDMGTKEIVEELDLDLSKPLNSKDRCLLQYSLLEHYKNLYAAPGDFIADRSPIDLMAYTLSEGRDDKWIESYLQECANLLNSLNVLVYIPIAIDIVTDTRSAPVSSMQRVDFLIRGAISLYIEERMIMTGPRYVKMAHEITDLTERVDTLSTLLQLF